MTGEYFNRNRYYSPALGRFTQKDPIGFNGGMNLYRYSDNNPVLFTDPMGLASVLSATTIIGLQARGFQVDSVMSAIMGSVRYGGSQGSLFGDLITKRLNERPDFYFRFGSNCHFLYDALLFDFPDSHSAYVDLLEIDRTYYGDKIMLASKLMHEFFEDKDGLLFDNTQQHKGATEQEYEFFRTLFYSDWSAWKPNRIYQEVSDHYPSNISHFNRIWESFGYPRDANSPNYDCFLEAAKSQKAF